MNKTKELEDKATIILGFGFSIIFINFALLLVLLFWFNKFTLFIFVVQFPVSTLMFLGVIKEFKRIKKEARYVRES